MSNKLSRAIERARADAKQWPVLCDALAAEFGAVGSAIVPMDNTLRQPWRAMSQSLKPILEDYLQNGWIKSDLRVQGVPIARERGYLLDSDLGREEELNKLPFFRDFLRKQGIGGYLGILFHVDGAEWIASIQLPLGIFVPSKEKLALVPDIRAALQNAAQTCLSSIDDFWDSCFANMDWLDKGVCLIGPDCKIHRQNNTAIGQLDLIDPKMAAKKDISQLRGPYFDYCMDQIKYADKLDASLTAPFIIASINGADIVAEIAPVKHERRMFSTTALALVTFHTCAPMEDDLAAMAKSSFELSPAEIALVLAICQGMSVKCAAQTLNIVEGTARQRLKDIYRKTGSNSQHHLVVNTFRERGMLNPR